MRRAIELARSSVAETRSDGRSPPAVGAVAVRDGELIGEAFRGQTGPGDHAEFGIVAQLGERSGALAGATVYTTLEPCTQRSEDKTPCATRLADEGVARVFIGCYDPDARVQRLGWARLRDAGIELCDFSSDLRAEVEAMLEPFRRNFTHGSQDRVGRFDFNQNGGRYEIEEGGVTFHTKWGGCGRDAVYAYGPVGTVALAKGARNFDEVDDPGAYHFHRHYELVRVGDVTVFRTGADFVLVRVLEVAGGPDWGTEHTEASIAWDPRLSE